MSSDPGERLPREFFIRDAETVARDLLGRYLVRRADGRIRAIARIVEAEAYLGAGDPASHAFGNRRTRRTSTMFELGGVAYVYLIYGLHHCLNVVVGPEGEAGAVLVRAAEAIDGEEWMRRNRGIGDSVRPGQIAGGPGKLCQALAVDLGFDGACLSSGELQLTAGRAVDRKAVATGPRIGVDYAGEAARWNLRFAVAGHPEMSRPLLGGAVRRS